MVYDACLQQHLLPVRRYEKEGKGREERDGRNECLYGDDNNVATIHCLRERLSLTISLLRAYRPLTTSSNPPLGFSLTLSILRRPATFVASSPIISMKSSVALETKSTASFEIVLTSGSSFIMLRTLAVGGRQRDETRMIRVDKRHLGKQYKNKGSSQDATMSSFF